MKNKNIVLCGFMGCGKTTVGKELACLNGYDLIDLDDFISQKMQLSVSEIFEKYGEDFFRDAEHSACKEILRRENPFVLSAGGGTLTFERNVKVLKENAVIVLLNVPLETISARLADDTSRPLLNAPDREKRLSELYLKRLPVYKACADFVVNADMPARDAAVNIMRSIGS